MSEPKEFRLESRAGKLFRLSVRSDGTASVVLDPKFDIFPVALTSKIAEQIETGYSDYDIGHIEEPILLITYGICGTELIRPSYPPAAPRTLLVRTHRNIGLANLVSLDAFRCQRLRDVDLEKVEWMQLTPCVQTSNPHFDQLHSIRVGDIGWGLDQDGCVSVSIVREAGAYVHRSSVYVQRTAIALGPEIEPRSASESAVGCKRPRTC